jgi:hypothetical protein
MLRWLYRSALCCGKRDMEAEADKFVYVILLQSNRYRNRTFLHLEHSFPTDTENVLLILVVPRKNRSSARKLKMKWSKQSRGKKGRLRKGLELAILHKYEFKIYSKASSLVESK